MDNKLYPKSYGRWAGKPNGTKPDYARCAEHVFGSYYSHQCSRKRGHGPDQAYCKQHAKKHGGAE